jgi:hypothetical protein
LRAIRLHAAMHGSTHGGSAARGVLPRARRTAGAARGARASGRLPPLAGLPRLPGARLPLPQYAARTRGAAAAKAHTARRAAIDVGLF